MPPTFIMCLYCCCALFVLQHILTTDAVPIANANGAKTKNHKKKTASKNEHNAADTKDYDANTVLTTADNGTDSFLPTNTVANDQAANLAALVTALPTASELLEMCADMGLQLASRGLAESGKLIEKAAPYAKAASLEAGRALFAGTKEGLRLTTNYVVIPAYERWIRDLVGQCARELLLMMDPNWKMSEERAAEENNPDQNLPESDASSPKASSSSSSSNVISEWRQKNAKKIAKIRKQRVKSDQRKGKAIFIDEQRAQQKLASKKVQQNKSTNEKLKAIVEYDESESDSD
uniref:Uncharacterized protein n=1 Tax=Globodera rostochiensis TaxID=31243 RepID=A0A914GTK1_GLORO